MIPENHMINVLDGFARTIVTIQSRQVCDRAVRKILGSVIGDNFPKIIKVLGWFCAQQPTFRRDIDASTAASERHS